MGWRNAAKPHKYRAESTVIDGIRFHSKLEATRYAQLKLLQQAGDVSWFIRQPSFDLGGGVIYRADFLVVYVMYSGTLAVVRIAVEDCKGYETKEFKIKKKLMAAQYPNVNLVLLTSKEVGK